jgi:hypothetical protein
MPDIDPHNRKRGTPLKKKNPPMGGVSGEESSLKKKWVPIGGCFKCSHIAAASIGDELPAYKIPLLGWLYGSTLGVSGESELFYEG